MKLQNRYHAYVSAMATDFNESPGKTSIVQNGQHFYIPLKYNSNEVRCTHAITIKGYG